MEIEILAALTEIQKELALLRLAILFGIIAFCIITSIKL